MTGHGEAFTVVAILRITGINVIETALSSMRLIVAR